MRHLHQFNNFLIQEAFVDIDLIKDLVDDYFLELLDESGESSLRLRYYVKVSDLEHENFSMSSSPSVGSLPIYDYELDLSSAVSLDVIKSIKRRIKNNPDFKVFSFKAKSQFELNTDDTTQESTRIAFSLVYLKNQPLQEPGIIAKLRPKLESMGYYLQEVDKCIFYLWKNEDDYILESSDGDVDYLFTKRKIGDTYIVRSGKLQELLDKTSQLALPIIMKEYEELKSVVPDLPEPKIVQALQNDTHLRYLSRSGNIEFHTRVQIVKPKDKFELNVMSQVSYHDRVKRVSGED